MSGCSNGENRVVPSVRCSCWGEFLRPVEVTAYYKTVSLPTYAGAIVSVDSTNAAKYISIGIIAWNEERTIGPMLESVDNFNIMLSEPE